MWVAKRQVYVLFEKPHHVCVQGGTITMIDNNHYYYFPSTTNVQLHPAGRHGYKDPNLVDAVSPFSCPTT